MARIQAQRMIIGLWLVVALLLASALLVAKSNAQISNPWALRTGRATHYDPTVGMGNCSLPLPSDLLVAAINTSDYGLADYCGASVTVNGPRGSVTVKIIDRCPGCVVGGIDLSPQAFERIAALEAGNVPITWQLISAPNLSGQLIYNYKEGSSQWWAGVQVRNHRNAIAKFEFRNPQGIFQAVERAHYNYFLVPGGMGIGPFTFRITDVYGNVVTDSNIPLRAEGDVAGNQQFPYVPSPSSTNTPTSMPTNSPTPLATKLPTSTNTPIPTAIPASATPTLVPTMAPPSPTATQHGINAWQAYTSYSVGSLVQHNGIRYRCIQAHTSLPGWEPQIVPALWQPI
ncbi:expansin EXLX1 family cellulose-binding protein [Herpetosiphon giganteus]|uniref:expansin EXLX1 family cellulose-binding protein n=1 Tax=Herpetosiphon giganteus TaxID=2029754 RepID=UPI00195A1CF2|nr:expansin EXLX1 family cellulose-binding protein [Herpetosiphon giganteus]MBM7844684.1 expansin (peptidoglycan-binding protein) [Herpetosiphon giganteus]